MAELIRIKCDCGKKFSSNPKKHPGREHIYCPRCHKAHPNKGYVSGWKPNVNWIKQRFPKLKSRKPKPETPSTLFPQNRKGFRPGMIKASGIQKVLMKDINLTPEQVKAQIDGLTEKQREQIELEKLTLPKIEDIPSPPPAAPLRTTDDVKKEKKNV